MVLRTLITGLCEYITWLLCMWLKIHICSPIFGSMGWATALFGSNGVFVCPRRKLMRVTPVASWLTENSGRAFMIGGMRRPGIINAGARLPRTW